MSRSLPERIRRRVLNVWRDALGHATIAPGRFQVAIVVMVSDEVHNRMRRLQLEILDRYGVNSGLRASPHISLKQGFRISGIERLERYFERLVTDIEPFDIAVKGVKSFEEEILFLDVEPNPRLETLRRRILRDLSEEFGVEPGRFEGDQYHFHATLEYGLPKAVLVSAQEAFGGARTECCFTLDTLGLLLRAGDGWTTYKRARLSRPSPQSAGKD